MPTQLDEILAHTRSLVAAIKSSAHLPGLERSAAAHRPRGFITALRSTALKHPAVIAELKKASPSRGLIRQNFSPVALGTQLAGAGAAALSILTDEKYFQGSLTYLEAVSAGVTIPCLRKDFYVDPFQALEARATGADAILLIVAAHTDADLATLSHAAHALELDVLWEAHDRQEIDRAANLGATLIGINSRDLRDFTMHPERMPELAAYIPASALAVAESGIRNASDLEHLRAAGYQAFLIGEALMREPDPAAALTHLLTPTPAVQLIASQT